MSEKEVLLNDVKHKLEFVFTFRTVFGLNPDFKAAYHHADYVKDREQLNERLLVENDWLAKAIRNVDACWRAVSKLVSVEQEDKELVVLNNLKNSFQRLHDTLTEIKAIVETQTDDLREKKEFPKKYQCDYELSRYKLVFNTLTEIEELFGIKANNAHIDFPFSRVYPNLARIFYSNQDIVSKLINTTKLDKADFFEIYPPLLQSLIKKDDDLQAVSDLLIRLARQIDPRTMSRFFKDDLPAIKNLIKSVDDLRFLVELSEKVQDNTEYLFPGLPVVENLIKSSEDLRIFCFLLYDLIKQNKSEYEVFNVILRPNMQFIKSSDDLRLFIELVGKTKRKNSLVLFTQGLRDVEHLIKSGNDLLIVGEVLNELFEKTPESGNLCYGISTVKRCIKSIDDLRVVGGLLVEFAGKAHSNDVGRLFEFGLNNVKQLINSIDDLRLVVELIGRVSPEKRLDFLQCLSSISGSIKSSNDLRIMGGSLVVLFAKISSEKINYFTTCFQRFRTLYYGNLFVELIERSSMKDLKLLIRETTAFLVMSDYFRSDADLRRLWFYLLKLFGFCQGVEHEVSGSVARLISYFDHFGVDIFDVLLLPVAERQGPATFLCFDLFADIYSNGGVKGDADLILLRNVCSIPIKGLDVLQYIVGEGLKVDKFSKPVSVDGPVLFAFLKSSPVVLLELFVEFKSLYLQNIPDFDSRAQALFVDAVKFKSDIVKGVVPVGRQELMVGVLYSTFSPMLTVDRKLYEKFIVERSDRQSDIPKVLDRLSDLNVGIESGSVKLKEGESVDTGPWRDLIEAVEFVNSNKVEFSPVEVGFGLLNPELSKFRKQYLIYLYAWWRRQGNSLPGFSSSFDVLGKYKEFVGDRLNDIIFGLLQVAHEADPAEFGRLIGKKAVDFSRLAKSLVGLWSSPLDRVQRTERVVGILSRNGFVVSSLDWPDGWGEKEILGWLSSNASSVVDKSIVARVKEALYGAQYRSMQGEIGKFNFVRGSGKKFFRFVLSKRKAHCVAMFNMGVCVAPDDELWNSPDMWQLIIFDENDNGCGGVIFRTIVERGKSYLVLSINPSDGILSIVNPRAVYDKIIQFAQSMVRLLKFDGLLIPVDANIQSNRSSMQDAILSSKYERLTLSRSYEFSYLRGFRYAYREFYVVPISWFNRVLGLFS